MLPSVEFFQPHSPSNDIPVNLVPFTGSLGVATQMFFRWFSEERMYIVWLPPSVREIWQPLVS